MIISRLLLEERLILEGGPEGRIVKTNQLGLRGDGGTGGQGHQEERYVPEYSEYIELLDTRENIFVATEQQVHYRRPLP